jgi:hypothetical protein
LLLKLTLSKVVQHSKSAGVSKTGCISGNKWGTGLVQGKTFTVLEADIREKVLDTSSTSSPYNTGIPVCPSPSKRPPIILSSKARVESRDVLGSFYGLEGEYVG